MATIKNVNGRKLSLYHHEGSMESFPVEADETIEVPGNLQVENEQDFVLGTGAAAGAYNKNVWELQGGGKGSEKQKSSQKATESTEVQSTAQAEGSSGFEGSKSTQSDSEPQEADSGKKTTEVK